MVLNPWFYLLLDIQTKELLRFTLWWSSETRDPKIGKGRHEILMKQNLAANNFYGKNSRFFLFFWELPVQLRPLITFPSPDQNFAEIQIFVFSPHSTTQGLFENTAFWNAFPLIVNPTEELGDDAISFFSPSSFEPGSVANNFQTQTTLL